MKLFSESNLIAMIFLPSASCLAILLILQETNSGQEANQFPTIAII